MNDIAKPKRAPQPRHCGVCRSLDHDARKCPELVPALPADRVAAIAKLREQLDALGIEIGEYERVKVHVDTRLNVDRAQMLFLEREIERLRGGP